MRRRLPRGPSFIVGAVLVATLVISALVSLVWTPYGPLTIVSSASNLGPSLAHPFGTDEYGRDILSRLMAGGRSTLYASCLATAIAMVIGIPLGLWASVSRRWVAEVILRLADLIYAFPALLAAIALVAAFGATTTVAAVAIGVASIPYFVRVTRSGALPVMNSEFVLAARAYGRSTPAIVRRHVVSNIMPLIIVQASLLFSVTILASAALAYLGLGTPAPAPTWGGMLQEAQGYIYQDAWMTIFPGVVIVLSVLGFNLLGDGIRDLLDPTLREV